MLKKQNINIKNNTLLSITGIAFASLLFPLVTNAIEDEAKSSVAETADKKYPSLSEQLLNGGMEEADELLKEGVEETTGKLIASRALLDAKIASAKGLLDSGITKSETCLNKVHTKMIAQLQLVVAIASAKSDEVKALILAEEDKKEADKAVKKAEKKVAKVLERATLSIVEGKSPEVEGHEAFAELERVKIEAVKAEEVMKAEEASLAKSGGSFREEVEKIKTIYVTGAENLNKIFRTATEAAIEALDLGDEAYRAENDEARETLLAAYKSAEQTLKAASDDAEVISKIGIAEEELTAGIAKAKAKVATLTKMTAEELVRCNESLTEAQRALKDARGILNEEVIKAREKLRAGAKVIEQLIDTETKRVAEINKRLE